ncbi:MAG: hypothetical protein EZS28_030329, partial [Streblomastix strix]
MNETLNDTRVTTRSMFTNRKLYEKEIQFQIRLGNKKHGKPFIMKQKEEPKRSLMEAQQPQKKRNTEQ